MNARTVLKVCGVLFCLLAISNFLKPMEFDDHTGFVFLGKRLSGTPNLVLGSLFGAYLAVYGTAVLRMRRLALTMAWPYAAYVIVNLILFAIRMPEEALGRPIFGLVYSIVAIGVSSGAAYLLSRNREALT